MPHTRPSIADKRKTFHRLHESGCFVLPNPWDVGSARYLQGLGFKALATTSAGFAWSHGHADGRMSRDRVLDHLTDMVEATNLPVNADFENGFGTDTAALADSVRLAVQSGVAGLSIEDSTGNASTPLFDLDTAVERMRAARNAIDKAGPDTMLIARCEAFLVGQPNIDTVIARLKAYANAGADCLYAPGIKTPDQIKAVVDAVAPKPVNLLTGFADLTLTQIGNLGVRRVSVGGALARAAWGGFMRAAKLIIEDGSFGGFTDAASGGELNKFFNSH
jgi:2-methylisocitrate lyase-like PEP mutase family enzyme